MGEKTMMENIQAYGLEKILTIFRENPEKNLPKVLDWADKLDRNDITLGQRRMFHDILDDPNNNWYKFVMNLLEDLDDGVRDTFFKNFLINSAVIGLQRQKKAQAEHGCNIPWAILMDPTSACNLNCTGCWAAEYGNQLNMTYRQRAVPSYGNDYGVSYPVHVRDLPLYQHALPR